MPPPPPHLPTSLQLAPFFYMSQHLISCNELCNDSESVRCRSGVVQTNGGRNGTVSRGQMSDLSQPQRWKASEHGHRPMRETTSEGLQESPNDRPTGSALGYNDFCDQMRAKWLPDPTPPTSSSSSSRSPSSTEHTVLRQWSVRVRLTVLPPGWGIGESAAPASIPSSESMPHLQSKQANGVEGEENSESPAEGVVSDELESDSGAERTNGRAAQGSTTSEGVEGGMSRISPPNSLYT